jgi:putative Mn2+ efflux pump MntP
MSAALALAVALAMDATAVAAARGAGRSSAREGVLLALLFGLFQAGMAALGWLGGAALGDWIDRWDHWIAFVLLSALGVRMIVEARRGGDDAADTPPGSLGLYLVLALATSIDAAAAGVTLPLLPVTPAVSLLAIGVVTTVLSGAGYAFARQLGARIGKRLELVGGLVLLGIGIRILLTHLGAG